MDSDSNSEQLLKQIHDAIERQANNSLRKNELTMVQVWVLLSLNDMENKSCSLKKLEQILNVAQSTCAGIVNRLVQKGLVEYFLAPNDKRMKIAHITSLGESCCLEAMQNINTIENVMFCGFSKEEKNTLEALLQKIYNNIK